jgi:hypothetical protein
MWIMATHSFASAILHHHRRKPLPSLYCIERGSEIRTREHMCAGVLFLLKSNEFDKYNWRYEILSRFICYIDDQVAMKIPLIT